MDSVENVTAGIPAQVPEATLDPAAAEPAADAASADGDAEAIAPAAPAPATGDPLAGLLRTGLELLTQLGSADGSRQAATGAAAPSPAVERIRDERSGQSYLKIRMPAPEVMERVVGALQGFLDSLRG